MSISGYLKHLRGKIEKWISIQGSFVVEELVGRLGIYPCARHNVLRSFGSVFVAPPTPVESLTRSSTGMFPVRMVPRVRDDVGRFNFKRVSAQWRSKIVVLLTVAR